MPFSATTIDGTAYHLLTEVETRLRAEVDGFNEATCFICDDPVPPDSYFPTGGVVCTIALVDGEFNGGHYIGGGANVLTETCSLVVTPMLNIVLDQPPRAKAALLNDSKGILTRYKPRILRALLVDDINAAILAPWFPVKDAKPLTRGALLPTRSQGPRKLQGADWIGLSLYFEVEFDWDLTLPAEA